MNSLKLLRNTTLRTYSNHPVRTRCTTIWDIPNKPQHLICFKQWTKEMVLRIINSALRLKCRFPDTQNTRLNILSDSKIMILQEVNKPIVQLAVSKAASLLGAQDVTIIDHVVWEDDYMGRVFSSMADAIFVSTATHMCVQRFANQSLVPVMCMHSRTHSSIRALATMMCIYEEFCTWDHVNIGWLGPPHPVLNSYLLLAPMLGADIKFKCCCDISPVSPLLFKAGEEMSEKSHTTMEACKNKEDVFKSVNVMIAGPTTKKKEKLKYFNFDVSDIEKGNNNKENKWIFLHTFPRGAEVKDTMMSHENNKTFQAFENMQYIAAALMASSVKCHYF